MNYSIILITLETHFHNCDHISVRWKTRHTDKKVTFCMNEWKEKSKDWMADIQINKPRWRHKEI